jgi:hypothetical protein
MSFALSLLGSRVPKTTFLFFASRAFAREIATAPVPMREIDIVSLKTTAQNNFLQKKKKKSEQM